MGEAYERRSMFVWVSQDFAQGQNTELEESFDPGPFQAVVGPW